MLWTNISIFFINERQEVRNERQETRLLQWKYIDFSIPLHCSRNDKLNVIAFANERQSFEVNVKRKAACAVLDSVLIQY
mgnify:CR=1 FL=1